MPAPRPAIPREVHASMPSLRELRRLQVAKQAHDRDIAVKAPPRHRPWHDIARPTQRPPEDGDWRIYLILAGRGWGKTATGSNWLAEQASRYPGTEWAVIAPIWRNCRKNCVEGETGLLNAFLPGELDSYNASDLLLRLTNGSRIYGYSADNPSRLRGANLSGAWIDELASMEKVDELWGETLMPALRIGHNPRTVITTTPRGIDLLKELVARDDGSVLTVRGSTWDNAENLSPMALADLRSRFEGTRLGAQELYGELLDDVEGALFSRALLDKTRVKTAPSLARVVVGVDPSVSSGDKADYTGIVVAGRGHDGDLYILADETTKGTIRACMSRAVKAYHTWAGDRIIGEVNNGGDFIEQVLRTVDEHIPYKSVRATRGKKLRAEPVAALFEQGRAHLVGTMPKLEDQMTTWTPDENKSPDNLDAAVWACAELMTGHAAMGYLAAISRYCPRCTLPNPKNARICGACGTEFDQN